jgi:hypothetical protein
VADLISPITEQLDSDLVLELFGVEDTKHIMEIPLRPRLKCGIGLMQEKEK